MCTAAAYLTKDFYFGRNFDLEYSYDERVTVTPRNFPLPFRKADTVTKHYALIGMAYISDGYPLYYDAMNEKGLCMAGLNFPGNACYYPPAEGKDNITPFEFIPWILSQCEDLSQARTLLERINLTAIDFSSSLPLSPLHWIISDRTGSLTVETLGDGMRVYENKVGILTNNPTFDMQMFNLTNYMSLSAEAVQNNFAPGFELLPYSRGMGAMGLPGDLSSASRFVKAAFTKLNSRSGDSEEQSVGQFFHILTSVEQQDGCVHMGGGKYEITIYSCCCNADKGIYYYTTYENRGISAVDMNREDLDGSALVSYSLDKKQKFDFQN